MFHYSEYQIFLKLISKMIKEKIKYGLLLIKCENELGEIKHHHENISMELLRAD